MFCMTKEEAALMHIQATQIQIPEILWTSLCVDVSANEKVT